MGWTNSHLHSFITSDSEISEISEFWEYDPEDKPLDAATIRIDSVFLDKKMKITYLYDFGDNWVHEILVEDFLPRDGKTNYPICTGGKSNCPPEDVGGIYGFYDLLDIIKDENHPEYEEMLEWLGDDYDPKYFDKDEINKMLATLRYSGSK